MPNSKSAIASSIPVPVWGSKKADPPVGTGGLYDKQITKRQSPRSRSKLGGTDARVAQAVG